MHLKRGNSKGTTRQIADTMLMSLLVSYALSLPQHGDRMDTSSSYLMLSTSSLPQFLVWPLTRIRDLCASCKFTNEAALCLEADDIFKDKLQVTDSASHDADKESAMQQQHGPA